MNERIAEYINCLGGVCGKRDISGDVRETFVKLREVYGRKVKMASQKNFI